MQKRSSLPWLALLLAACACSCRAVQFYQDTDKPFYYSGEKEPATRPYTDSLNVLTYNIKKAIKIPLAIAELRQIEQVRHTDIYLLQEMNEEGVQAIAKGLGLNYLYIPIVYDRSDKKNIGNAILTSGTITHPEKLILPHAKWQNQQRRDVTIGQVNIDGKKILVYSVHTETLAMSIEKRMDQVNEIIRHAKEQSVNYQYVIIGGDFNTLLAKDGRKVVEKFTSGGFDWPTKKVGTTARAVWGLMKPRHDYLFSKGLTMRQAFTIDTTRSSDHYPVFATFGYGEPVTAAAITGGK